MPTYKPKLKITLILPTYNEADNIKVLIEQLQEIFSSLPKYEFTILVVDDNSPDGTAETVRRLQKKYKNVYLLTGPKGGLGAAYVRGMKYAVEKLKADVFFEMDADLSHNPQLIPLFLREIEKGADLVIGSRYIAGGSIPQEWALHRKVFSIIGNLIVRFGLMIPQVHEWTSGYRAIRREVFVKINHGLHQFTGYTFQVAFLYRTIQAGLKVVEVPLNFVDRRYGKSKIAPLDYISKVILYILLNSTFIRFCLVGTIGFIINVLGLEIFYRLGLRPGPAAAIGAEFAIVSNFILNNFWTFSHKKIRERKSLLGKFLQFNIVAVGAIIIQGLAVGLGTAIFGDETRFLFLVLAVVIFVIPYSYFVYNRFIWQERRKYINKKA